MLGQIELHLTARAPSRAAADAALDAAVAQLRGVLGDSLFSIDGRPLEAIVGDALRSKGWTIAVAESCTGGLLASRLTDVPGSSAYVDRGVVCYSNRAKIELLGIAETLIAEHGAVSEPVARAMAVAIRAQARANVGVGVTGIAGPGGGTAEKPVGTVVIAVAGDDGARVRTFQFVGGREQVKFQAAQAALNMVRLMLADVREGAAVRRINAAYVHDMRLFIAIDLDDAARHSIASLQARLKAALGDGRSAWKWIRPSTCI